MQNSVSEIIIIPLQNYVKRIIFYNAIMKPRRKGYGDANLVGANIERLRKERGISQKDFIARVQAFGVDINPTSYSKLEGQLRLATDKELFAIAQILQVPVDSLF